ANELGAFVNKKVFYSFRKNEADETLPNQMDEIKMDEKLGWVDEKNEVDKKTINRLPEKIDEIVVARTKCGCNPQQKKE
ncbi:31497_t:CDS:2, partial [Gigaspora margarita]